MSSGKCHCFLRTSLIWQPLPCNSMCSAPSAGSPLPGMNLVKGYGLLPRIFHLNQYLANSHPVFFHSGLAPQHLPLRGEAWIPHLSRPPVPHHQQSAGGVFKISTSTSSSLLHQPPCGGNLPHSNSLFSTCTYLDLLSLQAATPQLHTTLNYLAPPLDADLHPKFLTRLGTCFSGFYNYTLSSPACPPARWLI